MLRLVARNATRARFLTPILHSIPTRPCRQNSTRQPWGAALKETLEPSSYETIIDRSSVHETRSLDPANLSFEHATDISNLALAHFHYNTNDFNLEYAYNSRYDPPQIPFPLNTRGVLYYYRPEDVPPVAGELRFRVFDSETESHDLLSPRGVPWALHLPHLHATNHPLLKLLVREQLVDPQLLKDLDAKGLKGWEKPRGGTIVHSLGQLFPVQFDRMRQGHMVIDATQPGIPDFVYLDLPGLFSKRVNVPHQKSKRHTYKEVLAFKGHALCAFEKSELPEHEGNRVLLLRIHKILSIEDSQPDDRTYTSAKNVISQKAFDRRVIPKPEQGELVRWTVEKNHAVGPRAWFVDHGDEEPVERALKGLFRDT